MNARSIDSRKLKFPPNECPRGKRNIHVHALHHIHASQHSPPPVTPHATERNTQEKNMSIARCVISRLREKTGIFYHELLAAVLDGRTPAATVEKIQEILPKIRENLMGGDIPSFKRGSEVLFVQIHCFVLFHQIFVVV
ncbi:hypothetical protein PABG_00581 [Paracoccidioides brasiliensis Pb03]|nr:hypothetical protein PABG_00581 [Paracoccidioides brasiliensis Pb03]